MEKKILLIGEVDEAQIKSWKSSHELGIFAVKKDGKIAYFKNASFKEIDAYHSLAARTNNVSEDWKTLAGLLFIGGHRELIESPRYLPDVVKKLQQSLANGESELVNL